MSPKRIPLAPKGLSFDAAVKTSARLHVMSPAILRESIKRYGEKDVLEPVKVKRMKREDPRHMLFGVGGPSLEVEKIVHRAVEEAARDNVYISLATIRAKIFSATGEEIPKSTMADWMGKMQLEYGEKKLSGLKAEYARALIRRFVFEYSELLSLERKKSHVLVWMDESYIHAGYCSHFSWFHRTDDVVPNRVRGSEKGKRLIIMHALTRDGMLEKLDANPSDSLEETCPSAAIVTSKLSAEGFEPEDYHDTLNGDRFIAWMKNRLIPAFESKYGRKKMILILDNASYHHARGEDWVTANKMNKLELANFLRRVGVSSIKLEDGRVVPASKFTADYKKDGSGGVKATDLKKVVADYIRSHPAINTTLVQQIMKPHGYRLVYTPPYESWLQPIELVWARVKHQVAKQSHSDRKWQETAEQTREALSGLSKELCASLITHTEKLMDEWLKTKDAGSLRQHGSLDALRLLSPTQRMQCTDLNLPDGLLTGDADEDQENQ
jgi:transposase